MLVWLAKIFRSLFLLIDKVIYWAINMVYQLFMMIAETGIFTPETIREFGGRIYVLLGVFMLFKVAFSMITYILNPDSLTDKNKGVGKLLTNFFVVLIGIIAIPYVFQAAFSLQTIVLKDNIIGNIVLGMDSSIADSQAGDYINNGGKLMSYTTLSAFIRPNPNIVGEDCASDYYDIGEDDSGNQVAVMKEECDDILSSITVNNGDNVSTVLIDAHNEKNINYFTDTDLVNLRTEIEDEDGNKIEDWVFDYTFIISSIAGGFLAWILLLFCIDIATRSVKLGFLQLIAPIPIISYIDPKSGKDGIFKKWVNQCVKTYVDLFVRLVAIYFAIFIISAIANGRIYNVVSGEPQRNIFVIIFIIFGALMFAKQLPDLISDITGVKLNGGFTLNPMNKLQQIPGVGWGATQLAGRTAGALYSMKNDQTGHRGRAALAGWFGAGQALKGQVPFTGNKAGSKTVRGWGIGRDTGYEIATGSKMRKQMPFSSYYREKGQQEIADLKKNVRAPLQQELSRIGLQKQETANAYKNLNEQLQTARTEQEREAIRARMQQVQERYQQLSAAEGKVTGDIGTVNDQIKDLERAYNIDKSTTTKLREVQDKIVDGSVRSGTYIDDLPPLVDTAPTGGGSAGGTVGGVDVSAPNASGERTTSGGIILPSGVNLDDK
ncbi:MAG: hypothetical protein E7169_04300 [Firmicutes bacterium]|nr:hypothetical protein [Bacillota bacterium]